MGLKRSDGKFSKTLLFNIVSATLLLLNELGPLIGMLPDAWQAPIRSTLGFGLALGNIVLRFVTVLPMGPATTAQAAEEVPPGEDPPTTSAP